MHTHRPGCHHHQRQRRRHQHRGWSTAAAATTCTADAATGEDLVAAAAAVAAPRCSFLAPSLSLSPPSHLALSVRRVIRGCVWAGEARRSNSGPATGSDEQVIRSHLWRCLQAFLTTHCSADETIKHCGRQKQRKSIKKLPSTCASRAKCETKMPPNLSALAWIETIWQQDLRYSANKRNKRISCKSAGGRMS